MIEYFFIMFLVFTPLNEEVHKESFCVESKNLYAVLGNLVTTMRMRDKEEIISFNIQKDDDCLERLKIK